MKKGSSFSVGSMAKIILIVLVLFVILTAINGLYGQVFTDGIKKFLGEQTDSEITHEKNLKAENSFENLEDEIKKCQTSKENSCGCMINLNELDSNYRIELTEKETKLINIKNQKGDGIQMSSFDASLNCYWGDNFKGIPLETIYFEDKPFIFKKIGIWTSITGRGNRYYFTHKFNLLKINNKLCWLADNVDENKIISIQECK